MSKLIVLLFVLIATLEYVVPRYLARYGYRRVHCVEYASVRMMTGGRHGERYGAAYMPMHYKSDRRLHVAWVTN